MPLIRLEVPPSSTLTGAGQGQPALAGGAPAPVPATTDVPGGGTATAGGGVAAAATSDPGIQPDTFYWGTALVLIVVGVLVGTLVYGTVPTTPPVPLPGISAFAGLYVAAQAIERVGEFISLMPGVGDKIGQTTVAGKRRTKSEALSGRNTATAEALKALATGQNQDAATQVAEAAANQRATATIRANRSAVFWGFNSLLASLLVGYLKLDLLSLVGLGTSVLPIFHVMVTGLAIGGGTKPLHDLIANLQSSKEAKQDAPAGD